MLNFCHLYFRTQWIYWFFIVFILYLFYNISFLFYSYYYFLLLRSLFFCIFFSFSTTYFFHDLFVSFIKCIYSLFQLHLDSFLLHCFPQISVNPWISRHCLWVNTGAVTMASALFQPATWFHELSCWFSCLFALTQS